MKYRWARAEALSRPYTGRLEKCGTSSRMVECGCGRRGIARTCGAHLVCGTCRTKRARKQGARIRAGLEFAWQKRARGERAVLLTLTARHTGDLKADRASIADGWRALRKRYHRHWGAFQFVGVWEVTPGTDRLGHVHLHVVALWPFRDWAVIARWWRQCCPTSTRINLRAARSVRGSAKYIAKYVSKGVEADGFTPELRARVIAGTYNTRWLLSSVRFFLPPPCCPGCGQWPVVVSSFGERWLSQPAGVWVEPDTPIRRWLELLQWS